MIHPRTPPSADSASPRVSSPERSPTARAALVRRSAANCAGRKGPGGGSGSHCVRARGHYAAARYPRAIVARATNRPARVSGNAAAIIARGATCAARPRFSRSCLLGSARARGNAGAVSAANGGLPSAQPGLTMPGRSPRARGVGPAGSPRCSAEMPRTNLWADWSLRLWNSLRGCLGIVYDAHNFFEFFYL